ncbi:MAG: hypothetical protein ABR601_04390 [Parasphingopyxis sp.]
MGGKARPCRRSKREIRATPRKSGMIRRRVCCSRWPDSRCCRSATGFSSRLLAKGLVTAVSARHFALVTGIVFYADRPDPIALGGASLTIGRACGSGGGSSRDRGRADVTCLSF